MELLIIIGILVAAYALVAAKRMSALITNFQIQSLMLCAFTLVEAMKGQFLNMYLVAFLIFIIKVIGIPFFLLRMLKTIKVSENLGFIINPQLSLLLALLFTYLSWIFAGALLPSTDVSIQIFTAASFSVILIGLFMMIFRLKALSQIIGLLVMENGIFLLAASVAGGVPFLVEMTIFFDVFVSVIILGLFVYRINELFTGIDVDQLNQLRG